MKFVLLLMLFATTSFAQNEWRLYPEDQEKELWHCKLSRSNDYKQLELTVGRMTSSMPIREYVGLAGIEQWKKEYYPDNVISTTPIWISFYNDKEGEVQDSVKVLSLIDQPVSDIMSNYNYKYSFTLDKRSGKATYGMEKRKKPCVLCGGWKYESSAELNCRLIK